MRLLSRLAALFLSLTFLVGVLVHDLAGAQMSIDMSAATNLEQQDELCLACAEGAGEQVVCDLDCTGPLLSLEPIAAALPQTFAATVLVWPADAVVRTRKPGFDPAPPRTNILS